MSDYFIHICKLDCAGVLHPLDICFDKMYVSLLSPDVLLFSYISSGILFAYSFSHHGCRNLCDAFVNIWSDWLVKHTVKLPLWILLRLWWPHPLKVYFYCLCPQQITSRACQSPWQPVWSTQLDLFYVGFRSERQTQPYRAGNTFILLQNRPRWKEYSHAVC